MKNYFEKKNYDFGILKTYFQKYFWAKKYFEIIIYFYNMISSKSDPKNIFYFDFNFCQIRELKYFLTSIFWSQIKKIFSILISIFSKIVHNSKNNHDVLNLDLFNMYKHVTAL